MKNTIIKLGMTRDGDSDNIYLKSFKPCGLEGGQETGIFYIDSNSARTLLTPDVIPDYLTVKHTA